MYKHILIPTDGSDLSQEAIEHGMALAKSVGARVTIAVQRIRSSVAMPLRYPADEVASIRCTL
jgi:nucleotide-binding universal stress UspA family protein